MDSAKKIHNLFGELKSNTDDIKTYSILMDAQNNNKKENMYDLVEKLISNEKENTKYALEQLWQIKNNLPTEQKNETLDILIEFYQTKMDALRNKEEKIKKITADSRELLVEKRKRDSELADIKQQIEDCERDINILNDKLKELKTREQELKLIDMQVSKELEINTNEVVNGLYEIILTNDKTNLNILQPKNITETSPQQRTYPSSPVVTSKLANVELPKAVVKTTTGKIIGEYYFNPNIEKTKRQYIYNSVFFYEAVTRNILQNNDDGHNNVYNILKDICNRSLKNSNIHFEESVNDILNLKQAEKLLELAKSNKFEDILHFALKLKEKIVSLGDTYRQKLEEQLEKLA